MAVKYYVIFLCYFKYCVHPSMQYQEIVYRVKWEFCDKWKSMDLYSVHHHQDWVHFWDLYLDWAEIGKGKKKKKKTSHLIFSCLKQL